MLLEEIDFLLERCLQAFNDIDYAVRIIKDASKNCDKDFPYFAVNNLIQSCADKMKMECLDVKIKITESNVLRK